MTMKHRKIRKAIKLLMGAEAYQNYEDAIRGTTEKQPETLDARICLLSGSLSLRVERHTGDANVILPATALWKIADLLKEMAAHELDILTTLIQADKIYNKDDFSDVKKREFDPNTDPRTSTLTGFNAFMNGGR